MTHNFVEVPKIMDYDNNIYFIAQVDIFTF
jgi:hypothetical protein